MNTTDPKIILDTDPKAATYRTDIKGWVSRTGLFYGDDPGAEQAARYDGCTHHKCSQCPNPTPKGRVYCPACAEAQKIAQYKARQRKKWDETGAIYSDKYDVFFSSWDDAEHFAATHATPPGVLSDLRLLICEPVYLRPLDPDYWMDDFPEDLEIPEEVLSAIDELNQVLKNYGPISWWPGKFAEETALHANKR